MTSEERRGRRQEGIEAGKLGERGEEVDTLS